MPTPGVLRALIDAPFRLRRITSSSLYVPQIDGLRFLAIAPVLFWHATLMGVRARPRGDLLSFVTHGHVGVFLFFFISGYIIAYPFMAGRPPRLRAFYRRRLLRLEPPYFLVMIGCFLILSTGVKVGAAPSREMLHAPLWQSLLASLVYMHGLIFASPPALNPPAWSLEIEIQFYLVAPLIFAAYLRLANRKLRLRLGAALVVTLLLVAEAVHSATPFESPWRYTLCAFGWMFFTGVVACDWAIEARPFQAELALKFDAGLVLGLVGLYLAGLLDSDRMDVAWPLALLRDLSVVGCLVLIYLGAARGVLGRRVLGTPWLALLGGACYSIYLTNVPVIRAVSTVTLKLVHPASQVTAVLVMLAVTIPASIVAGMVFYVLIERPCTDRQWPQKLARRLRLLKRPVVDSPAEQGRSGLSPR